MATSPVAVDYDPFASNQSDSTDSPKPVDYDPFAASSAPATAAPKEPRAFEFPGAAMESYFATPEGGKRAGEIATGFASGVGQTVTGLGEMHPLLGDISAKGTQELRKLGDPESQFIGGMTSGLLLPGAFLSKAPKIAEGASRVGNVLRGFKSGGITGGIYGLTTPTGKEDVGERLLEKGETGVLSALIGGPLGGILGAFAPRGTSPSELLRQYAGSLKEGGFAKEVIDGLANTEKSIQTSLEQQIRSIEASVPQKVDKLYRDVSGRLFDLYENAQKQADLIRQKGGAQAQEVADSVLNAARQQIQRARSLADEAVSRAITRQTTAQAGLKQIGDPSKELTDTLKPIRDQAVAREETVVKAQKEADSVLRNARDKLVAANEQAGITLDQMPAYQKLAQKIAPFDPATSPEIVQKTDPSVLNLYKRIRDAVLNKRVELTEDQAIKALELGFDVQQAGDRFYRTFKTSFEGADDARRFVGQIFKKDIAGYEAISGIEKQDIYGLLSRLEEEYVGATAQKELQANWAAASKTLDALEGKSGKTLLQLEEGTQAFNKPTAELGQYFFSSQDRVQNLIDLTGDAATVRKVAGDYVANQLRAQDSKGVQRFLNDPKNSDWLSHPALQGLKTDLTQYAQRLSRAETAQSAATKLTAKPIKTDTGRTTPSSYLSKQEAAAETARGKVLTQAEQEATGVLTEAEQFKKDALAGAKARETEIKKNAEESISAFKSAMNTGGGKIKQEYEGLKRYADMVLEAEKTAKPGQPPTTYTYSNLIQQMKSFLNERALDGTVPQNILLRESQKLDQIAATQSSELKSQLLRENLKMLAGQAGVVATGRIGHLPSLLKTTGRVLGGGL